MARGKTLYVDRVKSPSENKQLSHRHVGRIGQECEVQFHGQILSNRSRRLTVALAFAAFVMEGVAALAKVSPGTHGLGAVGAMSAHRLAVLGTGAFEGFLLLPLFPRPDQRRTR